MTDFPKWWKLLKTNSFNVKARKFAAERSPILRGITENFKENRIMWLYIWLGVTALALIIEFITSEMVSVWFVGGGLVALLLAGIGLDWYFHVPAFIVVSVALMLCFRNLVMKKLNKNTVRTNADSVIGKEFELLSDIGFNKAGEIKVKGIIWTAVTEDENAVIPAGTKVVVERIEGNKYIVKEI